MADAKTLVDFKQVSASLKELGSEPESAELSDLRLQAQQLLAESLPVRDLIEEHRFSRTVGLEAMSDAKVLLATEFPDTSVLFEEPALRFAETKRVLDTTVAPYNAVGKLVFKTPGGGSAHGSAWVCDRNLIATCAHNFFDSSGISSNALFFPGLDVYANESQPYRVISVQFHSDYRSNRSQSDIAVCEIAGAFPDSITPLPMQVMSDYSRFDSNQFRTLGYPGHSRFDFGQVQWECLGRYIYAEGGDSQFPHCPVKASELGPGCSGGPWVGQREEGDWVAVGLCSGPSSEYSNPGKRKIASTKSPFFDHATIVKGLIESQERVSIVHRPVA